MPVMVDQPAGCDGLRSAKSGHRHAPPKIVDNQFLDGQRVRLPNAGF